MSPLNSQFVKATALEVGFDACGLAEAGPVDPAYLATYDDWLSHGGHAEMHFLERHRDLRTHPANLLPGTRTVISLLLGYKSDDRVPFIAQYAYGEDYHDKMKRMLHALAAKLKEAYPGIETRPCVDSAPIPEKYWAIRAGLGWRGRNTLLIHPQFGSFVNLGELLVTLPADAYDSPLPNGCPPHCRACLTACPNGAITTPEPPAPPENPETPRQPIFNFQCSIFSSQRCTAYQTIESRAPELPAGLDTAGYAFGCDRCQLACPYNQKSPTRYHLTPERRAELLSLLTLATPAPEEPAPAHSSPAALFKRLTKGTALERITYAQWLRNVANIDINKLSTA